MKLKQISGLGTAAALDIGTTAGCAVQLGTGGALPAVDGSNLTNITVGGGGVEASIPLMNYVSISITGNYQLGSSYSSGSFISVDTSGCSSATDFYLPAASDYAEGKYLTISLNKVTSNTIQSITIKTKPNTSDIFGSGTSTTTSLLISSLTSRHSSYSFMSNGVSSWHPLSLGNS